MGMTVDVSVGINKDLNLDSSFLTNIGLCYFAGKEAMTSGATPIVIDNTNIERWTMKPYVVMVIKDIKLNGAQWAGSSLPKQALDCTWKY